MKAYFKQQGGDLVALPPGSDKSLKEFKIFDSRYPLPYHNSADIPSSTKDDILMAATILFATKGYSAVSMRDIADAVSIQAASLYNHFSSKKSLWNAVLTHCA